MQRTIYKKISIALLLMMLGISMTACEMDPAMLEMLVSVLAGFCGASGGPFAQMAGGQGGEGYQIGSMFRDIYMSQSDNSQSGRDMSTVMRGNQMMFDGLAGMGSIYNSSKKESSNIGKTTITDNSGTKPEENLTMLGEDVDPSSGTDKE